MSTTTTTTANKPRLATAWLDGCSGCHMSLLDMDELIIELSQKVEFVCSPLMDVKEFPENVDVAMVEGAVGSEEDLHKIHKIRARSKFLVVFGDCGITANVVSMRNSFRPAEILDSVYRENAEPGGRPPTSVVPKLLPKARPVHEIVKVDLFIPGCPPSADTIFFAVSELLAGRVPDMSTKTRFGA